MKNMSDPTLYINKADDDILYFVFYRQIFINDAYRFQKKLYEKMETYKETKSIIIDFINVTPSRMKFDRIATILTDFVEEHEVTIKINATRYQLDMHPFDMYFEEIDLIEVYPDADPEELQDESLPTPPSQRVIRGIVAALVLFAGLSLAFGVTMLAMSQREYKVVISVCAFVLAYEAILIINAAYKRHLDIYSAVCLERPSLKSFVQGERCFE